MAISPSKAKETAKPDEFIQTQVDNLEKIIDDFLGKNFHKAAEKCEFNLPQDISSGAVEILLYKYRDAGWNVEIQYRETYVGKQDPSLVFGTNNK